MIRAAHWPVFRGWGWETVRDTAVERRMWQGPLNAGAAVVKRTH